MNLNATIFGQMISFVFFIWFCMKYIWPPILLNIKNRKKKIKNIFKKIDQEKKNIIQKKKKINIKIQHAKNYIKKIIEQAYKEKSIILEKNMCEITLLKKKIFNQANKDIKIMESNLREKLNKEIHEIVILIVKKVIQNSLTIQQHDQFIKKIILNLKGI